MSCCEHPSPDAKKTPRTPEQKKKLLNRLSRLEGQIRGLKGMIDGDAYCTDVLTQSAAAVAALHSFNRELLASHIRGCVVHELHDGNEDVIDDLLAVLQKMMK